MDVYEIESTSTEYIRTEVTARVTGGFENPTTGQPYMAFRAQGTGDAETADYQPAQWEAGGPPYHMRRIATGLAEGRYDIWSRVVLGSEDVRRKVGVLVVT